ncbi:MAG: TonB-dependent receptor [Bacteroidetes bacterium]|nr:TonB-dependent receptor [Bacteroidota bacterium]MBU2557805.1 TonB-dependent receptor [Bacteroidota bacterium]
MSKFLTVLFAAVLLSTLAVAQQSGEKFLVKGVILNDKNEPMQAAHVYLQERAETALTAADGSFLFENLKAGTYRLHVSYIGYQCIHPYRFSISDHDVEINVIMEPEGVDLDEVVVQSDSRKANQTNAQPVVTANTQFIKENRGSSLMTSLEKLPGVQAIAIGQGFSKPMIRGLSFNRVLVSENNIKMEGQQWGADHGLEVDQFAVEQLEVIKGPSSLRFGSDALGGVVQIKPHVIAAPGHVETEIGFIARSVNKLLGYSVRSRVRTEKFFAYARYTHTRFSDYKVPADSFYYNRYRFAIPDKKLNNTAGKEQNVYVTAGWLGDWGKLSFSASKVFSKTGFFPGAHGIPSAEKLKDDGSDRNIALPFQQVGHSKLSANGFLMIRKNKLSFDLAYQQNHRQEWSLFHSHYTNQSQPLIDPDLELEWFLDTYIANVAYRIEKPRHHFDLGISTLTQQNVIGGYAFLLPAYQKSGVGLFFLNSNRISESLSFNWGLRYDLGQLDLGYYVSPYTDKVKSPDFSGVYNDFSWAAGLIYNAGKQLLLKLNVAKSFRMPGASELGSNGIHHGSFRYELGDTSLQSEYAYQLDFELEYRRGRWFFGLSPFAGYFPNFIYLNPTGSYLMPDGSEIEEADAGQVYRYVQSEAFRVGGEIQLAYRLSSLFSFDAHAEYVTASDGVYPIPFTPPLNFVVGIDHVLPTYWKKLHLTRMRLEMVAVSKQSQVARNEAITPGYQLLNLSFSTKVITRYFPLGIDLQWQNMLNTKYFNHLSFYRHLELPEAGSNIQLLITIPINNSFKK